MLYSLLRHPGSLAIFVTHFTILAFSSYTYSDTQFFPQALSSLAAANIRMMSSEELMSSGHDSVESYSLNYDQTNRYVMNVRWLQEGMDETTDSYEGDDALQELAESALKNIWATLVDEDQHYDRYTPVVNGDFSVNHKGTEYGLRLSGDTLKFRVEYAF